EQSGVVGLDCGPGKSISPCFISRTRCALTQLRRGLTLPWGLASPIFLRDDLRKRGRDCFSRCRRSRIGYRPIAFSHPVALIWGVLTRPEHSLRGYIRY